MRYGRPDRMARRWQGPLYLPGGRGKNRSVTSTESVLHEVNRRGQRVGGVWFDEVSGASTRNDTAAEDWGTH